MRGRRAWAGAAVVAALLVTPFAPVVISGPARAAADPLLMDQWALSRIGAPEAWARSTGEDVLIGIVDTGVDLHHEDLAGRVAASISCVGSGGDPRRCAGDGHDDNGHGTHVAGIAAAAKDNGRGGSGVAPGARLVVAKAIRANGSASTDDISAAVRWVVDHGARVVNLSLGGTFLVDAPSGSSLLESIWYAWSRGAVPVVAAGNSDLLVGLGESRYGGLPAIVVGATGPDDSLAGYSAPTGNARWAVMAPGGTAAGTPSGDIVSTYWVKGQRDQYRALAGTSMAAPLVAGTVALLLSQGVSAPAAVDRVLATADKRVPCGFGSLWCAGRLDAAAAVGP